MLITDYTRRPDDPPLGREQLVEVLAVQRVKRLLSDPKSLKRYRDRQQTDKHDRVQAALARAVREGAGHG